MSSCDRFQELSLLRNFRRQKRRAEIIEPSDFRFHLIDRHSDKGATDAETVDARSFSRLH
jgi:hypothetical protein